MKLNKIFSVVAGLGLLCGAYSCTDKIEPTITPAVGNAEVYFPYTDSPQLAIPLDATTISLTINRVDASEDITVGLTSKVTYTDDTDATNPVTVDVTDIFTIPSTISFPAGEKELTLEIGVDFSKVIVDRAYNIDLTLDAEYVGDYGLGHRVFTAIYLPWTDWVPVSTAELGTYTVGVLAEGYFMDTVYVRQSLVNDSLSQYSMFLPYEALDIAEEYSQMIFNMDKSQKIDVDGVLCPMVWMENAIDMNYVNSQTGEFVWYTTTYTWLKYYYGGGGQFTDEEIAKVIASNGAHYSYFNPVEGRFYLYMQMFSETYYYGGMQGTLETMQLPGDYHDYYFTFNYSGNLVDTKGSEYAMVQVVASDDVDHYVCEILAGELTGDNLDKAYDALANDGDAEYIYDQSYTMQYFFAEPGKYTAIAVGYNAANEVVCKGSATYAFESVQKESQWHSLGYCDYTDGIFCGFFFDEDYLFTWEVELEEHNDTPGLYRLVNPYQDWPLANAVVAQLNWKYADGNSYMVLDCTDPDFVHMEDNELGLYVNSTINGSLAGWVSACDYSYFYIEGGNDPAIVKEYGYGGLLDDDYITFPAGQLLLFTQDGDGYLTNLDPSLIDDENAKPSEGEGAFCVDLAPALGAHAKKVAPKTHFPSVVSLKRAVDAKKAVVEKPKAKRFTKQQTNSMVSVDNKIKR